MEYNKIMLRNLFILVGGGGGVLLNGWSGAEQGFDGTLQTL